MDHWNSLLNGVERIREIVSAWVSKIPGWLAAAWSGFVKGLKVALDAIWFALKKIGHFLNQYVVPPFLGPWQIYNGGQHWATWVTRFVSDAQGRGSAQQLVADDYWWGPAGKAYGDAITQQQNSLSQLADIARGIRETLTSLGSSLQWLYVLMAVVIVLFAIEVNVKDIPAALSGVGIPLALASVLASAITAAMALGVILGFIFASFMDAGNKFSTLLELQNDYDNFPDGHWPMLPGTMKNVSALNGRPQDWQIR